MDTNLLTKYWLVNDSLTKAMMKYDPVSCEIKMFIILCIQEASVIILESRKK